MNLLKSIKSLFGIGAPKAMTEVPLIKTETLEKFPVRAKFERQYTRCEIYGRHKGRKSRIHKHPKQNEIAS